MGKYIIAGNWKMNKLPSETYDYIKEVIDATKGSECEVVCCTPFVCLPQAVEAAKGSHVKIGAENLHFEDKGAFTGEVSAEMLKDLGVDYVIMGHSERREYNNETDETVNLKAKKALEKGLIPIVCCGESLEQREAGITMDWIAIQIKKAFAGISADDAIIEINSSTDFALISFCEKSSSISKTESLLNTSRCTFSFVSGAAIANISFTGSPSIESKSVPFLITIAASPGFVTALPL